MMASPLRHRMQEEDKFWEKDDEFISGWLRWTWPLRLKREFVS